MGATAEEVRGDDEPRPVYQGSSHQHVLTIVLILGNKRQQVSFPPTATLKDIFQVTEQTFSIDASSRRFHLQFGVPIQTLQPPFVGGASGSEKTLAEVGIRNRDAIRVHLLESQNYRWSWKLPPPAWRDPIIRHWMAATVVVVGVLLVAISQQETVSTTTQILDENSNEISIPIGTTTDGVDLHDDNLKNKDVRLISSRKFDHSEDGESQLKANIPGYNSVDDIPLSHPLFLDDFGVHYISSQQDQSDELFKSGLTFEGLPMSGSVKAHLARLLMKILMDPRSQYSKYKRSEDRRSFIRLAQNDPDTRNLCGTGGFLERPFEFDDDSVIDLAAILETNSYLTCLRVSGIGDEGGKSLARVLSVHPSLSMVDIRDGSVGDEGFLALAEAIQSSEVLSEFYMSESTSGDAGFRAMARAFMYNSRSIDLRLCEGKQDETQLRFVDALASSTSAEDLNLALRIINRMPSGDALSRAKWLLPWINDQFAISNSPVDTDKLPSDYVNPTLLTLRALIGQGQFGKVYLAMLTTRSVGKVHIDGLETSAVPFNIAQRWVVVKYVRTGLALQSEEDVIVNILKERQTNRLISSKSMSNIVQYVGEVRSPDGSERGMIFELCADRSTLNPKDLTSPSFIFQDRKHDGKIEDWSDRIISSLRMAVVFAPNPRGQFAVHQILDMLLRVAKALQNVHKLGYVHRDIADRNILWDGNGTVQLADFGLAKYVGFGSSDNEETDQINRYEKYLTPGNHYAVAWWPPECIGDDGQKAIFSANSDVYSFGVLMWQCFAHRDPFDDVKPASYEPEDVEEAALKIIEKIWNGERPDLSVLDWDTPEELVRLIEQCWETNPDNRPTLRDVITRLEALVASKDVKSSKEGYFKVKSSRDVKKRWFDVRRMFLRMPPSELIQRMRKEAANTVVNPSVSFTFQILLDRLRQVKHDLAPSRSADLELADTFGIHRPLDVFLGHTGAQKLEQVSAMRDAYELCNLRCFLDKDMTPRTGSNRAAMSFHLETCRYAVFVVSKEFLKRDDPVSELAYAFRRQEWLIHNGFADWQSLWVVLFNLSVEDYKKAQKEDDRLPDLAASLTLLKWSKAGCDYESWPHLYHSMKAEMIKHDNDDGAVETWKRFLRSWNSLDGFPRADDVY